jgi:alkylated DNA repair dioxygenase AlkB
MNRKTNIPQNEKYNLDKKSNVHYYKDFLSKKEADELFIHLKSLNEWTHGEYNMYGKIIKTPRLLWAMSDKNFDITKSYNVTESSIWTKEIEKIKKKTEKFTNKKIKYAQMNLYRDGNDHIGWHCDSEVKEDESIISLSLGATRKFQFRHKQYKENKEGMHQCLLEHGSLVEFDYHASCKNWKHRIPKEPKIDKERINVTFRMS